MKKVQLLVAALLISGAAFAQTTPNAKPAAQGKAGVIRNLPGNTQAGATLRSAGSVDNESFLMQAGNNNFGSIDQIGRDNSADMVQMGNNNDAYQKQRGGGATGGDNKAFTNQYGNNSYSDQDQSGLRNEGIIEQGNSGFLGARDNNYAVQEQDGTDNYGYIDQDSGSNFAHQKQNGTANFVDTRQGNQPLGLSLEGNQWSQTIQNGNNNTGVVRQDHD